MTKRKHVQFDGAAYRNQRVEQGLEIRLVHGDAVRSLLADGWTDPLYISVESLHWSNWDGQVYGVHACM